jgi:hypothetical protein
MSITPFHPHDAHPPLNERYGLISTAADKISDTMAHANPENAE